MNQHWLHYPPIAHTEPGMASPLRSYFFEDAYLPNVGSAFSSGASSERRC